MPLSEITSHKKLPAVNLPPVIVDDDPFKSVINIPLTGKFGTKNYDPEGGLIKYSVNTGLPAAAGTLLVNEDGTFIFIPKAGYTGLITFVYNACDADNNCASGIVTIIIGTDATTQKPDALDDDFSSVTNLNLSANVSFNDSDPDTDKSKLIYTKETSPTTGTLKFFADGSFIFTPTTGFNGTDEFKYKIIDEAGNFDIATVKLTYAGGPLPPEGKPDYFTINANTTLNSSVKDNDRNPEGSVNLLRFKLITPTARGVLTPATDFLTSGKFTYVPEANYTGNVQFIYEVTNAGSSSLVSVFIKIIAANKPPVVTSSTISTFINTPKSADIKDKSSDPEGSKLTYEVTKAPLHGSLDLTFFKDFGIFIYTPGYDIDAKDVFYYKAIDNLGNSTETFVRINVVKRNEPPVIVDDGLFVTPEDVPINISFLLNDYDPEGSKLTVKFTSQLLKGTKQDNPDGTFLYSPDFNKTGDDELSYEIYDNLQQKASGKLLIRITPVNDAPEGKPAIFNIFQDAPLDSFVIATDAENDAITYTFTNGAHGTVVKTAPEGSFQYISNPGYSGSDQFTYTVCDQSKCSLPIKVYLTIVKVNSPPIVNDLFVTTTRNRQIKNSVVKNAQDPEGKTLTYRLINQGDKGVFELAADGSFSYKPFRNILGTDIIIYEVKDADGKTSLGKVTIEILPSNEAPTAEDAEFLVEQDAFLDDKVSKIAKDADGDSFTFTLIDAPKHHTGTFTLQSDGAFSYTPLAGYAGNDAFTYKICDEFGACSIIYKVFLTVDAYARVYLTEEVTNVKEGREIILTARLTKSVTEDIYITLNASGEAQNDLDYNIYIIQNRIKIPAGQTSTKEKIILAALKDDIQEGSEALYVTVQTVSSPFLRIGEGATVLIEDDFPPYVPAESAEPNKDIIVDPYLSPNQDNMGNESFVINNILSFPGNEVIIYNRQGNIVYSVLDYNNVDVAFKGTANVAKGGVALNSQLPDGVYFYVIKTYTIVNSIKHTFYNRGTLILKR